MLLLRIPSALQFGEGQKAMKLTVATFAHAVATLVAADAAATAPACSVILLELALSGKMEAVLLLFQNLHRLSGHLCDMFSGSQGCWNSSGIRLIASLCQQGSSKDWSG